MFAAFALMSHKATSTAATPVRAAVQELPGVLDAVRILADEQGRYMVLEVAHHGQFTPVECGVAQARISLVGSDLEGYEIAIRTGDDDLGCSNSHDSFSVMRLGTLQSIQVEREVTSVVANGPQRTRL